MPIAANANPISTQAGTASRIRPLEAIRPVIPSLRWLAETETFGRDEKAWREWLLRRLEERRRAGTLVPG